MRQQFLKKAASKDSVQKIPASNTSLSVGTLPLNKQAEKVLKVTFLEAKMLKSEEISPEHLVLSILKHKENPASKILNQFDVDYEIYKAELEYVKQEQAVTFVYAAADERRNSAVALKEFLERGKK